MRYHVSHRTTYEYQASAALSHHQIRLRPREVPNQRLLSHRLEIEPVPRDTAPHVDYHGNPVLFATLEGAHSRLTIRSTFEIEVAPRAYPEPQETPAWERVRDWSRGVQQGAALQANEFLFDSPLIRPGDEFAEFAERSFEKGRPILEAALDLAGRIHAGFKFDPKATDVTTPVTQVLKEKRGVCQDFAHLQIACLRSLGLPVRYVSGYLNTHPPPGKPRLAGADASHAWISFYCDGLGWMDVDPTNNLLPRDEHITLAWGRDYSDISPVRGVMVGSGSHSLKVAVDVEPIAESDPAA